MSDGLVSIKDRKKHNPEAYRETHKQKKSTFNPYKYVSPNLVNSQTDHIINQTTKQYLKKYDKHLKKFNATKALDEALAVNFKIFIIVY